MHYYKRNLGDYAKKAGRLSMLEHGAYTLLIDSCYDREQFPTLQQAIDWCWARSEAEIEAVKFVLNKFFTLEGEIYVQKRIQEELAEYHQKAIKNKEIATERENKRKEKARTVHETSPQEHKAPPNHKPITNNHKPRNNTLAKAKAASGDLSTKDEIWKAGKSLLSEQGMPEKQCGSFVGKLVKDYGADTVVDAVRVAVLERPADAASYLKAVCQRNSGERKPMQSFRERDAQLASDRVAMVAPSIAANKTAPYVDAADFIEAMAKPKPLEIAND